MNHSGLGHVKWMALIAAGLFGVLLLFGNPAGEALRYAILLACPLMMVGMMFGGHSGHSGHSGHGNGRGDEASAAPRADKDEPVSHHHTS